MTCLEFRKWMRAFADGELDTEHNLDALEHLRMCPPCAARVDNARAVRRALFRQGRTIVAPPDLGDAILARLDESNSGSAHAASSRWVPLPWRPWTLVAVAAVLALAALGSKQSWWPGGLVEADATLLPSQQVADIRNLHQRCCLQPETHHNPGLPLHPTQAALELARDLRLDVIMPDLSLFGFDFVGANRCELRGHGAAHALYRSKVTGDYLSVFTVDREADCRPAEHYQVQGRTYYVCDLNSAGRECVVAWCGGDQTYIWCGQRCAKSLIQLACSTSNR